MKRRIQISAAIVAGAMVFQSCKKFDQINVNPIAAGENQVQVEYFINTSIIGAQMDPDVAERSFVLYWQNAAHMEEDEGFSSGSYDDGWTTAYYNKVSSWLNSINTAIQVGENQIKAGTAKSYTKNLIQVARIWRAYLMSEVSDNFGPVPVSGFSGVNPEFTDVKTVYYYMLAELKDAVNTIDASVINADGVSKEDPAYGYNYTKWQKYGNSLRMRFAMRLSEVDAAKAKTEFEDAAKGGVYISDYADAFKVQEKQGWDDLTGVMSREWDPEFLSQTMFNIYFGLGSVPSSAQVADSLKTYIKPANWMGVAYNDHFSIMSNDPSKGYWFDGLPNTIDPRAYTAFKIPGNFSDPNFCFYPSWTTQAKTTVRPLNNDNGTAVVTIDAKGTWNPAINGNWGAKGTKNRVKYYYPGTMPRLGLNFRNSTNQRIFFAPWETYFLLAEAAERGWATPVTAQTAYEKGIAASFAYWGVSSYLNTYLASTDYNRTGTSVSWGHVTEAATGKAMKFKNGYTNDSSTVNYAYPKNQLYKSGTANNDHMNKIILQKYIAQYPWLPLEAWNDFRRLGLPFFENPAIETPIVEMPQLTSANYMTSQVNFFPQRLKYPSSLPNSNPAGYKQAVNALGGKDDIFTPLWWAKK